MVVGASLVVVELLIRRLGLEAYGVWTLVQTIVLYATTAELGIGPALARFTSLHATHPHRPRQILFGGMALYLALGLAVVGSCRAFGGPFIDLFSVPAMLRQDAVETVHLVGWITLAALVAGGLGHVLSGLERFSAFTWSNILGSATFLTALVVLLRDDPRLQDVAHAALLQWTLVAVIRLCLLHRLVLRRGPWRPGRQLIREMFGFSMRLQVAVAATLVNTQTDRVVIAAVAPASTLGQAGVATQVADAGRFLGYAAFSPVMSRMAVEYGERGKPALDALYARQRRTWTIGLFGAIAVACGAVHPAIAAWLGPDLDEAGVFAALLIAGYGLGLLPNPAFGYLRAVGAPGLEGRYGIITVAINIVATIILGIAFGAIGVVVATAVAYTASTWWVILRARPMLPASREAPIPMLRVVPAMAVCGAAVLAAGEGLLAVAPRPVALAGVIVVTGAVFAAYLTALAGLRPLALLRGLRGAAR